MTQRIILHGEPAFLKQSPLGWTGVVCPPPISPALTPAPPFPPPLPPQVDGLVSEGWFVKLDKPGGHRISPGWTSRRTWSGASMVPPWKKDDTWLCRFYHNKVPKIHVVLLAGFWLLILITRNEFFGLPDFCLVSYKKDCWPPIEVLKPSKKMFISKVCFTSK